MPRWSVVIPSDSQDNLRLSAASILQAHPNCSPSDILVLTRKLSAEDGRGFLRDLTYVRDPEEVFSFARRVNLGMDTAQGDVVVMGDDVEVVTRNAFDILAETATIRVLAPAVRGRVGPPWQREAEGYPEVPFVSFICVYLSRMVLKIVGPLETRFPGYGYEDTDYCLRARKAGLSIGVDSRVIVEHNVRLQSVFQMTYGNALGQLEENARQAFVAKWMGT